MKKINYLVVIFLLFIACKKDPPNDTTPNDTTVSGKWEWFQTTRGLNPIPLTPQNSGRSWSLILNADLTCTQSGDLLSTQSMLNSVGTGTYTLANVYPGTGGIYKTTGEITISLPNYKMFYPFFLKKSQDTLILDQGSQVDGAAHFFIRK